jgi:hypothetical protein
MWDELEREPVFVLTGDQDWAPSWALERQLTVAAEGGAPLHLFVTNDDPLVRDPLNGLTLGLHPNFLPGSSHGTDPVQVVEHCLRLVPGATTVRCHAFAESTYWLRELVARGIRADSNMAVMLQPGLVPLLHVTGLLRFPVFLEDDVLLRRLPTLDDLRPRLFTPGLKVLNFHPSHVAINARSPGDYAEARTALFERGDPVPPHPGHGVAALLRAVLEEVGRRGATVLSFPELVARGEALAALWRPSATA